MVDIPYIHLRIREPLTHPLVTRLVDAALKCQYEGYFRPLQNEQKSALTEDMAQFNSSRYMTVRVSYSGSLTTNVLFLYCLTEHDILLSIGTRPLIRFNRHRMVKVDKEKSSQSYIAVASKQSELRRPGRNGLSRRGSR